MKTRRMRRGSGPFIELKALLPAVALLGAFLETPSARAEVSPTATARQLAIEGIDQVEAGNCERGEPLLEGAEKLHHASVHLQYLARCRARAGRLVAATELWRQIINEGAPPGSSPAVQAAVAEATTELARTLPRLGAATIRTTGNYPGLELSLDGSTLPSVVLGAKQVLDPGPHELIARAPGYTEWTKRWAIAEGQTIDIQIALARSDGKPDGLKGGPTSERSARGGGVLSTTGWFVGAAGVAAMTAGVVTWIKRNDKRSQLEHDCPQFTCRPPYTEETLTSAQNSIRNLTTTTNILMFGGGALVAGGVTMILLGASKSRATNTTAKVSPIAGPKGAGLVLSGQW